MKRVIVIDRCMDCPYLNTNDRPGTHEYYCHEIMQLISTKDANAKVHDNCTLQLASEFAESNFNIDENEQSPNNPDSQ